MTLPKNVDDLYPLTPMQRLMLLHAISAAGNGVLLNQVSYDIRGAFDADAFHRAWDAVVARHPALRTAFLWDGLEQPLQVVRTVVPVPYRTVDLSALAPEAQDQALEELRREDADTPMTLGRAPLMRCTVVRLGPDHHCFLWAIHHLVVDRWSHGVLFADLRTLYSAFARGEVPQLDPPPRFRDHVEWVGKQQRSVAEGFWRGELVGFRGLKPLAGTDATQRRGARLTTRRTLSLQTTNAFRDRAIRSRTTQAAVLLSSIGLLVAERTGSDDLVLGVTVSGRPPHLPGAEATVGSFVNNLPARLVIRREETLEAWTREVQRGQARRESFAHVSLGDIHGWSELAPSRALFDTLVLLNLTNDSELEWPGISMSPRGGTLDAGYALVISVTIEDDRLVLALVHDDTFRDAEYLLTDLDAMVMRISAAPASAVVGDLLPPATVTLSTGTHSHRSGNGSNGNGNGAHGNGANGHKALGTLADALLETWRDVLGIDDIGLDDDFFALGGTSLQAAQLFARVERTVGKTLPLSTLFGAGSVRALVAEIDRPLPREGSLVHMRSSGSRAPLYAIPGIGGNVVGLAGLARQMGPDQPFRAFESPGLDGREAPLLSIEAIAERYVGELLRDNDREFHLLGICWGAAVAFEMASQLTARGHAPASVVLMDPAVLLRETARPVRVEPTFIRKRLELYWDEFLDGDWTDRGRLLASKAKRAAKVLTGTESLERSQTEHNQARVREANKDAITRYVPTPLSARARIFITAERVVGAGEDPRYEWLKLIAPSPGVVPIGGTDSGDAISPAKVGGFAAALRAWLDSVAAETR